MSSTSGIHLEFQYDDDIRGLVLTTTSDGINEAARDQVSRQQLLRVFVKFIKEDHCSMKLLPPIRVDVICDGCNRSPIIGVRYKCLECFDYALFETQTAVFEENQQDNEENIAYDIEIIPTNVLPGDFVQLSPNESIHVFLDHQAVN
ncbi:unnamed protein product [Rotaria magnacalcarata]